MYDCIERYGEGFVKVSFLEEAEKYYEMGLELA